MASKNERTLNRPLNFSFNPLLDIIQYQRLHIFNRVCINKKYALNEFKCIYYSFRTIKSHKNALELTGFTG